MKHTTVFHDLQEYVRPLGRGPSTSRGQGPLGPDGGIKEVLRTAATSSLPTTHRSLTVGPSVVL